MKRMMLVLALLAAPTPGVARTESAALSARVQRVEDYLAIERIQVDYAGFFDRRDIDGYVGLFTEDGEWANEAGSHKGRAAIRAMLDGMIGKSPVPNLANYHIVSNPRIELHGDTAKATSRYVFVTRGPEGQPTPVLSGVYHDELVRQGGRWLIKKRFAETVMPTSEEYRRLRQAQQGAGK